MQKTQQSTEPNRTEGDVNLSERRSEFVDRHLDEATRAILDEDARYFLHQSLSTPCLNALSGVDGSYMIDTQGRRILDFHGNSVHQVGHAHPRVVEAVKRQLDELAFCPRRFANQTAIDLAKRLADLAPVREGGSNAKVLLTPGGTAAIGIALKLVRLATGRFKTISMWDSFHGASLDAISIGGESLFRDRMGPLLPGCLHVPPYEPEGVGCGSADYIEYIMQREGDIAAVIAEPMRWTTVVPPPREYWQQVRESCDRHDVLLIIDEIPACLGRTGEMFCCENFGIEPDILVIGKGLGGGVFPMAAVIARGDLDIAGDRALGHYTHEKSPVGAAAALATLDVIEEEQLIARAQLLGRQTLAQLHERVGGLKIVHEVRGLGLQMAIELRRDSAKAIDEAERVLYDCLERGLSFKVSDGNVLTLTPPLTISEKEMNEAIEILEAAVRDTM